MFETKGKLGKKALYASTVIFLAGATQAGDVEDLTQSFYGINQSKFVEERCKTNQQFTTEAFALPSVVAEKPLARRLYEDDLKMEKMAGFNGAMKSVQQKMGMNSSARQNLVKALDEKIETVKKILKGQGKKENFSENFLDAIGQTMRAEFLAQNPNADQFTRVEYYRKAYGFLVSKQKALESGSDAALCEHALKMELGSQVMERFSVEKTFYRDLTGGQKEFAGVALFDKTTGQMLLVFADADVSPGTYRASADGFDLYEGYAQNYDKIRDEVRGVIDSKKAEIKDIVAIGEGAGAANALQAVVAIKKQHENLQAGVLGYNMPAVYAASSVAGVEELVGHENVVFTKQKSGFLRGFWNDVVIGVKEVGVKAKNIAESVQQKAKTQAKKGFFAKAWNGFKGIFA